MIIGEECDEMPLTIIPMVINLISGGALMAEACGASKYISLGLCAAINIGLVIYTLVTSQWTVTIGIAITPLLLIIWSLPMVYIFEKKEGNEQ